MTQGKIPAWLEVYNSALAASASELWDFELETYAKWRNSIPWDQIFLQVDRAATITIDEDSDLVMHFIAAGTYAIAYAGLKIRKLKITNEDSVNALKYSILCQQTGA